MATDILTRARQFVGTLPHSRALQMQVADAIAGKVTLSMPWSEDIVGDPRTGVVFGGAVSALIDTCGGVAVFTHENAGASVATLDLRIDYMRSATPGQTIVAQAHCYHMTHHVAFVRATAYDDDRDNPVATAAGAFAVERRMAPA